MQIRIPRPDELAAMAAQQQPRPAAFQVASPLNDIQLIVLAAAEIYSGEAISEERAVKAARRIFVEAVVQEHEASLATAIEARLKALHPAENTPAGEQFILPGTK
jgi:hypothetical protein